MQVGFASPVVNNRILSQVQMGAVASSLILSESHGGDYISFYLIPALQSLITFSDSFELSLATCPIIHTPQMITG